MEGLGRLCCQAKQDDPPSGTDSRHLDIAPLGILQDDAIAIMILVCAAPDLPVRIERGNLFEPGGQHPGACTFPLGACRNVEDSQVLGRGCWRNRVGSTVRELEVVTSTTEAEHDAVEPFMVLEATYNAQAKAFTVQRLCSHQIAHWPCDSEVTQHRERLVRLGAV